LAVITLSNYQVDDDQTIQGKFMIRKHLYLIGFLLTAAPTILVTAQLTIGNGAPYPATILSINHSNKGLLLPTFQLKHKDSTAPVVNPATGLLMYNDAKTFDGIIEYAPFFWNGSSWSMLQWYDRVWGLGGNRGNSTLGTLNDADVVFRRNNIRSGVIGVTNTAFGYGSLLNTSGTQNTAFGLNSLAANTTGSSNSAHGAEALAQNTTGSFNTAMGYSAMALNTDGSYNTALGAYALYANNGSYNTAVGYFAMSNLSTGNRNTAVGFNAQVGNGLTYATVIGANATVTASNSLVLGGTGAQAVTVGVNNAFPETDLDIDQGSGDTAGIRLWYPTLAANWRFFADSATRDFHFQRNGVLRGYIDRPDGKYYATSDQRLKTDIQPLGQVLPNVLQLNPVTYQYADNPAGSQPAYGFVAQEVEALFPALVTTKEDTGLKGIAYETMGVVAIKAVQEQQEMIDAELKRITALKNRIAALERGGKK
jgi:hypothetical protein